MLRDLMDPEARHGGLFRIALGALVVAQLVLFWMLCSQQVRKAEARNTEVHMARTALADCLQYIPGSTIGSCTERVAQGDVPASQPATATQVGFVGYR